MSNENKVYVNTIFSEGDETYRPFLTVKAPKHWPTKRMAFYKSTGSSNNDGKNEFRKETWFPTLGLLQNNSSLYDDLNKGEDGYILKRNVFSKIFNMLIANWDRVVLMEITKFGKITQYLEKKISPSKKIGEEIKKVGEFCGVLAYYFQYWWQIQISAQLGEGYWENIPEFKEFVLTHDYDDYKGNNNVIFTERSTKLTPIDIEYKVDIHTKDDASKVMEVLNKEHAIIQELLYDDYKLHKAKLMIFFKKGVSISKQRKSKSPSSEKILIETKKRKISFSSEPKNTVKRKRSPVISIKKSTRKRV